MVAVLDKCLANRSELDKITLCVYQKSKGVDV